MRRSLPLRSVVVKIGSHLLFENGRVRRPVLKNLCAEIHRLKVEGRQVVLVSSGAIRCGEPYLQKKLSPSAKKVTQELQAAAAVGQPLLMQHYMKSFQKLGVIVAQVLLTRDDLAQRKRQQNARNTLATLLAKGVLPIVNENDTVATEEIQAMRFGDNDLLAALVCTALPADGLVLLTDVPGFFACGKLQQEIADPLPLLPHAGGPSRGMGGMQNKLLAAAMVRRMGGHVVIASGKERDVLQRIFQGEPLGSYVPPAKKRLSLRKCWLTFCLVERGKIVVNEGAAQALWDRKSLLPAGILRAEGNFSEGEKVAVRTASGRTIAVGITNYSKDALENLAGLKTSAIRERLGYFRGEEAVHKDNLVLVEELFAP